MLAALVPQAAVSLGPAALTYPELAAALTKAGMPTLTSVSLRSRAAYVSLHNRSPEAVRRLLGEALSVAFEPQRKGDWLMVADPEVNGRDRRFLLAYRRLAREAILKAEAEVAARTQGRSYSMFLADVRARMDDAESRRLSEAESDELRTRMWIAQPNLWTGARVLPADLVAAIDGPIVRRFPFRALSMPSLVYNPFRQKDGQDVRDETAIPDDTPVVQSLRFDPRTALFSVDTQVVRPNLRGLQGGVPLVVKEGKVAAGMAMAPVFYLSAEMGDVAETFHAMGPEAERYLASLTPADLPDTPKLSGLLPSSLSETIEGIGGCDAIVELSPRFESFYWQGQPSGEGVDSLRTLFVTSPKNPWVLFGPNGWLGETPKALKAISERTGKRNWPWRAVLRDGVLLAMDPYGFLDRAQPLPAASFLRVSRILAESSPNATGSAPTWGQAVRIVAAARPELELRQMDVVYRGLGGNFLLPLQTAVEEIGALSASDRRLLWETLRREGRATFPRRGGTVSVQASPMEGSVYMLFVYAKDSEGKVLSGGGASFDGRGTLIP